MIVSAFVSFFGVYLILSHLSPQARRRLVGYVAIVDLCLHGLILWMFFGTSTMGLLQAEAAGICFSLYLRAYRKLQGYEKFERGRWVRYEGIRT
jgi:hypothetical protein